MSKSRAAAVTRNALIGSLLLAIFLLILRFFYVVTVHGNSCDSPDFCFFTSPVRRRTPAGEDPSGEFWLEQVRFYSSVFEDLIMEGFLSPGSKSLSFGSPQGYEVAALRQIGVTDSIGIGRKPSPPLVVAAAVSLRAPFPDGLFDFVFVGVGTIELSKSPVDLTLEIARMVKQDWFLVVHTLTAGDAYSRNSLLHLLPEFRLVKSVEIKRPDSSVVHSILLQKNRSKPERYRVGNSSLCATKEYMTDLVKLAEPLIEEEPLKPWVTLKKNVKNVKYLTNLVDISFKRRYVYVDVGARSYGSSIGGWFRKKYPKQNKTFEVYAIEADRAFHDEYASKKGVKLLPFAAWVRNESLSFEVSHDPDVRVDEVQGKGMGRIREESELSGGENVQTIQGFDFAEWMKSILSEQDYVVVKMDIEGIEFNLIPRLISTGAICLVDEMFLECHYNRWQRCCRGVRTQKYNHSYSQCLEQFSSLRKSGVLVHQWL